MPFFKKAFVLKEITLRLKCTQKPKHNYNITVVLFWQQKILSRMKISEVLKGKKVIRYCMVYIGFYEKPK